MGEVSKVRRGGGERKNGRTMYDYFILDIFSIKGNWGEGAEGEEGKW